MAWRCVLCDHRSPNPEPHWCAIGFVKHFARVATRRKLLTLWERVN